MLCITLIVNTISSLACICLYLTHKEDEVVCKNPSIPDLVLKMEKEKENKTISFAANESEGNIGKNVNQLVVYGIKAT